MQQRFFFILTFLLLFLSACQSAPPLSRSPSQKADASLVLRDLIRVELSSASIGNGTLALVQIKPLALSQVEELEENLRVEFEGLNLPVFRAGEKSAPELDAFLPVAYLRAPGVAHVEVSWRGLQEESKRVSLSFQVVLEKYHSEVLKVQALKVSPTRKKDLERIQKEQAEVGAIYQKVTEEKHWKGSFQLPIESAVTSEFGTQRVYNGKFKNFHTGLDLRAAMNTPVYAPAPGRVVLAKDLFFTGNTVMIDHGYGLITLYAHLNEFKVKKGDRVRTQQILGLSGKTGRVNGPHLHWQSVIHGVKVNPLGLLQSWMP